MTLPPIWARALLELEPTAAELAAPLAADDADEADEADDVAAEETAAGVEAAALLLLLAAALLVAGLAEEAPVQAERMGRAAAPAAPAPRIRNMFLRFSAFPCKLESVTIDLQIIVDRLSTLK